MKKIEKLHKSYKGISRLERYMLSLIKENNLVIFKIRELKRLYDLGERQIYNVVFSLKRKGILTALKRGTYVLNEEIPGREFEIASELIKPSYISFWSALSYYGFTEQQPRVIQVVSTKEVKDISFMKNKIEVTTFIPERFFGYTEIDNFVIGLKEKVLVDSLSNLEKVGGLSEFSKCLKNAWDEIDKEKFVVFLLRFKNKSMVARAGYLIETLGLKINRDLKERIKKNLPEGFVKLDTHGRKRRKYDKKWKININWVDK